MTLTAQAAELESKKVQEQQKLANNQQEKQLEVISIFGQRNQLATTTGSAFVLGEETLEQFEFDDIHQRRRWLWVTAQYWFTWCNDRKE